MLQTDSLNVVMAKSHTAIPDSSFTMFSLKLIWVWFKILKALLHSIAWCLFVPAKVTLSISYIYIPHIYIIISPLVASQYTSDVKKNLQVPMVAHCELMKQVARVVGCLVVLGPLGGWFREVYGRVWKFLKTNKKKCCQMIFAKRC